MSYIQAMSVDSDRLESLRPDARRFILGVVWLCAIGVLTLDRASILSAVYFLDEAAAALVHVTVPPFVVIFLAILAGVVLPYCLAVTLMPISILVANLALHLQRKLKDKGDAEPVQHEAMIAVMTDLGINIDLDFSALELYVRVRSPRLARGLDLRGDQINFRGYATLPASILLAWLIFHLLVTSVMPALAYGLAALIGLAAFVLAAEQTNRQFRELIVDTMWAALLAAKSHAKSPGKS